uniref:Histidine-containing phosphotransfer protein n=1 Tax=Aegilops tauschii subsp. strangulata TaxID=200361 RepID=A0A453FF62_AEGTS
PRPAGAGGRLSPVRRLPAGHLDEQFRQVEDLQDEASPNFVEEVVVVFFKDSGRLISNLEQALGEVPQRFQQVGCIHAATERQ